MNDFLNNFWSANFWLSVIFLSIVLNIIAAYFRDILDNTYSIFSKKWKISSINRRIKREAQITALITDEKILNEYLHQELKVRLQSLYFVVFGFFSVFFGFLLDFRFKEEILFDILGIITLIIGVIFILMGIGNYLIAEKDSKLYEEAKKNRKKK